MSAPNCQGTLLPPPCPGPSLAPAAPRAGARALAGPASSPTPWPITKKVIGLGLFPKPGFSYLDNPTLSSPWMSMDATLQTFTSHNQLEQGPRAVPTPSVPTFLPRGAWEWWRQRLLCHVVTAAALEPGTV